MMNVAYAFFIGIGITAAIALVVLGFAMAAKALITSDEGTGTHVLRKGSRGPA